MRLADDLAGQLAVHGLLIKAKAALWLAVRQLVGLEPLHDLLQLARHLPAWMAVQFIPIHLYASVELETAVLLYHPDISPAACVCCDANVTN